MKKKNPPRGGQPWDQAKRRQPMPPIKETPDVLPPVMKERGRVSKPGIPFPNMQDLTKGVRDILAEFDDELFLEPEETGVPERKKTYRVKDVSEVKVPIQSVAENSIQRDFLAKESVYSPIENSPIYNGGLSFGRQDVVRGIIMSEILQPPRAKRPIKR